MNEGEVAAAGHLRQGFERSLTLASWQASHAYDAIGSRVAASTTRYDHDHDALGVHDLHRGRVELDARVASAGVDDEVTAGDWDAHLTAKVEQSEEAAL